MNRFFAFYLFVLSAGTGFAGDIKGLFSYNVFNTPSGKPFLETYFTIYGNSVIYKQLPGGKYQGTLEISIALFRKDSVFAPKKYNLLSPEVSDTSQRPAFIDQQRISVPEGVYALEVTITDPNSVSKKKFTINERIEVSFPKSQVNISDVQLVEKFSKATTPSVLTKSGYDLLPYSAGLYTDEMTRLAFYCEAYNTEELIGKNERFIFMYHIENASTKDLIEGYAGFDKQQTAPVNVLLGQMDIANIRSGSYNLVIEVKDQYNKLLAVRKVYFRRKNKEIKSELSDLSGIVTDSTFISSVTNADTLVEYIRCLWPVSSVSERQYAQNQVAKKDVKLMQKYFYAFWKNHNSQDPAGEWNKYHKQVDIVNTIFAAGKVKGYATDRGRVYLQYGTPDSRQEVLSESNSYPYEIWQYYRLVDPGSGQIQTNKRFVFCNNEIAGNNYKLIHSEARGEMFDARWKLRIQKRTVQGANLDFENPSGTYGNNLDDNWIAPK
jgi:GWxTD domain-containing protein